MHLQNLRLRNLLQRFTVYKHSQEHGDVIIRPRVYNSRNRPTWTPVSATFSTHTHSPLLFRYKSYVCCKKLRLLAIQL